MSFNVNYSAVMRKLQYDTPNYNVNDGRAK